MPMTPGLAALELRALQDVEGQTRVLLEALDIGLNDPSIQENEERRIKLRDIAKNAITTIKGHLTALDSIRKAAKVPHEHSRPKGRTGRT